MPTHRTLAVTAFNRKLYGEYAHQFVETFQGVDLAVYSEDTLDIKSHALYYQKDFVARNAHRPRRGFKFDAVRFCYKPYAILQAIDELGDYTRIAWFDADTVFHKPISEQWITDNLHTEGVMTYMGRPNYHSETGILLFNLHNPDTIRYVKAVTNMYDTDSIYLEREWHDSYIWDVVRQRFETQGVKFRNIGVDYKVQDGHIANYLFQDTLDHRKGKRKSTGTTQRIERK